VKAKKKSKVEILPLSDEEMGKHAIRLSIQARMNGREVFKGDDIPIEERLFFEALHYRSRKRIIITMDETFSSMGTSPIAICKDHEGHVRHIGTSFPMAELGFDTSRGQRFLVTVDVLLPAKNMKPEKNPFRTKYRPKKGKKTRCGST
jgi:hypothetical protein